jgi:hypothetical protein
MHAQVLNLSENDHIGAPGTQALAHALRTNRTVHTLNLNENMLCGDAGAVALAEMLRANATLTFVTLDQNKIGDVGAVALAEALKVNRTVKRIYLVRAGCVLRDLLLEMPCTEFVFVCSTFLPVSHADGQLYWC